LFKAVVASKRLGDINPGWEVIVSKPRVPISYIALFACKICHLLSILHL